MSPVSSDQPSNTSNGLSGQILAGSLDFDLASPNGAVEHEGRYTTRTSSNGTRIHICDCGVADGGGELVAAGTPEAVARRKTHTGAVLREIPTERQPPAVERVPH